MKWLHREYRNQTEFNDDCNGFLCPVATDVCATDVVVVYRGIHVNIAVCSGVGRTGHIRQLILRFAGRPDDVVVVMSPFYQIALQTVRRTVQLCLLTTHSQRVLWLLRQSTKCVWLFTETNTIIVICKWYHVNTTWWTKIQHRIAIAITDW